MAERPVKCLYCGESFYRDKEPYEMIGKRYAHKACYEARQADTDYEDKIHNMMKNLLGDAYSRNKINQQIRNFRKEGKDAKGMYNALVYFYEVRQNNTDKANGGIGIVPYVYVEAKNYFNRQEILQKKHSGVDISSYVDSDVEVIKVKKKPVRKPMRTHFFKLD